MLSSNQCEATCSGEMADRFGYVAGSRCTARMGHSIYRNCVGHLFTRRPVK